MLIYDPALDPYHSVIRILSILSKNIEGLDVELVRIMDFYLAYPTKLAEIKLPTNLVYIRKEAEKLITPYRNSPKSKSHFERMKPIFTAALLGLIAAEYLDPDRANKGMLLLNFEKIPEDLSLVISNYCNRNSKVKQFVFDELPTIKYYGPGGLKERTGLLGYKYDV